MAILERMKILENRILHSCNEIYSDQLHRPFPLVLVNNQVLEINLVPKKTCPGDCVYCPYKATTRKTVDREHFYPVNKVLNEIGRHLHKDKMIEQIIISGFGEPALNADVHQIIHNIKNLITKPITINSCGSLLWRESVRHDLLCADCVHINIDAAEKSVFKNVNRFLLMVPFSRYLDGMITFRQRFKGKFVINVTLLEGLNTNENHLQRLSTLIKHLDPTMVNIKTFSDDTGTINFRVDKQKIEDFASYFGNIAFVKGS
jgi:GTP-binding protein